MDASKPQPVLFRFTRRTIVIILLVEAIIAGAFVAGILLWPRDPYPLSWDDQHDMRWVYRSNYKATMRKLWLDCNLLVGSGTVEGEPLWGNMLANASNIQRNALNLAMMWDNIGRDGKKLCDDAKYDDWVGAMRDYEWMWASCNDCHADTWSALYRHATEDVVEAWKNGDVNAKTEEHLDFNPPMEIEHRRMMQRLDHAMRGIEAAIRGRAAKLLEEEVKRIDADASIQAGFWRNIAAQAAQITQHVRDRNIKAVQPAYLTMVTQCVGCHSTQVKEPREMLTPLPWNAKP